MSTFAWTVEENDDNSVSIVGVVAEIGTRYLPNTSQKRYRLRELGR
jgi:hypothetical protein